MEVASVYIIALAIAGILGLNIGGSGVAPAMAVAYASGAARRRHALGLFAVFCFLGAAIGGRAVTVTLSSALVPRTLFTPQAVLIISAAAALALGLSNWLRVPQSTSQVAVAAIAGVGMAHGVLQPAALGRVLATWLVTPLGAFFLSYIVCLTLGRPLQRWVSRQPAPRAARLQRWLVLGAGCHVAFAVGTNNVANAMAPLVGSGYVSLTEGVVLGGLLLGLGGLLLGGQVISTVGSDIAQLTLTQGVMVSLVAGSVVITASCLGMPTSLVQTVTLAVLGIQCGRQPLGTVVRHRVVQRIGLIWLTAPAVAFFASFSLM
jgi:PiT family inorganic phosphate transporter/sulfate permease